MSDFRWGVALLALGITAWSSAGHAEGSLALVGGEVHPVVGPPIPGGAVLISGARIVAVGRGLALPPGTQVIDCTGKRVTPGLIDAYTQIGLVEVSAIPPTVDFQVARKDPVRAAIEVISAIDPRSSLIPVARRHGVTSVLSAPAGGLIAGRSAWLDLVAPRGAGLEDGAVQSPVAMHAALGEDGAAQVGGSRAAAVTLLGEVLDDARLYQSNRRAFERNGLRRLATSRLDLEALTMVLDRRLPLMVSVHRAPDILAVLRLAERERIRVVLLGVTEGWLVADELARAKVPVIVDPMDNLPGRFETRNARSDNAALLAKAGVKLAITTASSHNAGNLRFSLGNAVRAGLPAELALRAATLGPAEILGRAKDYGSLEAGKLANVVVWSGDPFQPSSWAERVIVRGKLQDTETRQTRLGARYRTRLQME